MEHVPFPSEEGARLKPFPEESPKPDPRFDPLQGGLVITWEVDKEQNGSLMSCEKSSWLSNFIGHIGVNLYWASYWKAICTSEKVWEFRSVGLRKGVDS